ncbi:MAG: ABC transporter substrate-binding protein [Actinomycetota bacterium]|nr:ABC transporter substrate-binding protein [Actinomycetota bacterium]
MRSKKYVIAGFGLLAAAVALAALGASTASGHGKRSSAKTLVIGAALDLSNQMSPFDGPALKAAQLEAKKINSRGGANKMKIQIKVCDHGLVPAKGTSCAQKLISQGAKILLVTCDVDYATPAATVALSKKLLTVAPCIGTDQMGPKRFGSKLGKLAFSFGNVAQDEGAAMAEIAIQKKWKRAFVVTDNLLVYFKNVTQAFTKRYKQLGGKVVKTESFKNGDKTIGAVARRAAATNAQVIATSTAFGDWPAFFAGVRSAGGNQVIMNSWAGDGNYWYPKGVKVSKYWYVTFASVFGDDPSKAVRRLIAQMKAGGAAPGTGGFLPGAGAIDAIAAAVKKTKSTNGNKLADAFLHFKKQATISGKVSFTKKFHTVFGRAYRVIEVQNNKPRFRRLYTAKKPANIG